MCTNLTIVTSRRRSPVTPLTTNGDPPRVAIIVHRQDITRLVQIYQKRAINQVGLVESSRSASKKTTNFCCRIVVQVGHRWSQEWQISELDPTLSLHIRPTDRKWRPRRHHPIKVTRMKDTRVVIAHHLQINRDSYCHLPRHTLQWADTRNPKNHRWVFCWSSTTRSQHSFV